METNETVGFIYRQTKAIHYYLARKGYYNQRVSVITTSTRLDRPRSETIWSWLLSLLETKPDWTNVDRPFSFRADANDESLVMLETGQLARKRLSESGYEVLDLLTLTPGELEDVKAKLEKWISLINGFDRRFTESKRRHR